MELFSVKREEWRLFSLMFAVVCFINVNFNILRSMRNALVVGEVGGSAALIPYYELFGTFPMSIIMTWGLSRLMRVFSLRFIFFITTACFLLFFVIFAFFIYPHRGEIQSLLESQVHVLFSLPQLKAAFAHWPDMSFYVMAELWKVALLAVLFWGFVNQNLSLEEAKRFYPPLMLGSSVGTVVAGWITVFCTAESSWRFFALASERWHHSLYALTVCLLLCGGLTLLGFGSLFDRFRVHNTTPLVNTSKGKEPFSRRLLSLSSSLRYLLKSPYLAALLFVVVGEYVAYTLGELIFLETLKARYSTPAEYCQYMGNLTLWTGILTAGSALFFTPYFLNRYSWTTCMLITPVLMVIITVAFFSVIYSGRIGLLSPAQLLIIAIPLGSLHFCFGRSMKYTLFDSTKELAFLPLEEEGKVKGKLIIDGIGSRLGRGSSSLLSLCLFTLMGGAGESALFAGILAVVFSLFSIPTAHFIGKEFQRLTKRVIL